MPLPETSRITLTPRQVQVLRRLLEGECNKEIAVSVGCTEQTVKEHLKIIMVKTGRHTRLALATACLKGHILIETYVDVSEVAVLHFKPVAVP